MPNEERAESLQNPNDNNPEANALEFEEADLPGAPGGEAYFRKSFDRMGNPTQAAMRSQYEEAFTTPEETLEWLEGLPTRGHNASEKMKELVNEKHSTLFTAIELACKNDNAAYVETLVALIRATAGNDTADAMRANIRNWIAGESCPTIETQAFILCFALQLDALEAQDFLQKACYMNVYNFRKTKHIFYSLGLQFGLTYDGTESILIRYLHKTISAEQKEALQNGEALKYIFSTTQGDAKIKKFWEFLIHNKDLLSDTSPGAHFLALLQALLASTPLAKECLKQVDLNAVVGNSSEWIAGSDFDAVFSVIEDQKRRGSLIRYLDEHFLQGLSQYCGTLPPETVAAVYETAFSRVWNNADYMIRVYYDLVARDNAHRYAPRGGGTTRAHEAVMDVVLRGEYRDPDLYETIDTIRYKLVDLRNEQDDVASLQNEIDGALDEMATLIGGLLRVSSKSFIGYSKTAYQRYLWYRIRLTKQIIRESSETTMPPSPAGESIDENTVDLKVLESYAEALQEHGKVSDPEFVFNLYGKYANLTLRANGERRDRSEKEIDIKLLAQAGIEEMPAINYFSRVRKNPATLTTSEWGRSILFLFYFYGFVSDSYIRELAIEKFYDEHPGLAGAEGISHENYLSFYYGLCKLAYDCGLAIPYPRRRFDALLLRAAAELDNRNNGDDQPLVYFGELIEYVYDTDSERYDA
ncbi:MAG: hypothetical protein LBI64_03925 [Coriobacteriales bacterium]|jgi:hypothetical protein|nr:hypothetical protein [Coriobacteriales bacterium]